MSARVIPTTGEPPTPRSFDSTLDLSRHWVCHLESLQTEDQGLVAFDLSSWTLPILIDLCYALGLCHVFSKVVLCPIPSCFLLFSWAPSRPTMLPPQSSGGTTRKQLAFVIEMLCNVQSLSTFRPSSSLFPTACATASLSEPARVVTGTQCLLGAHLSVASLQGQLGFWG